jgi:hypothetical protein
MKKNFISKFFSFFAGVIDTADKHSFANISANFRNNFFLLAGADGNKCHEKISLNIVLAALSTSWKPLANR